MPVAGGIVYNGIQYLMEYMSSKKEVTIGITINLENYENLRLEVEGDVETHEDVDDLVTFLDGMLARLGRGDQATAERVDAYRRRVLAVRPAEPRAPPAGPAPEEKAAGPEAPETPETEPAHGEEEKACPSPDVIEAAIPPAPEHPEPPRIPQPPVKLEEKVPAEPEAAPEQAPPAQEPVAAKPPAAPGEDVCEMCGAGVTKSQAKLSQLFMSKTLCKKCMEQP
jgi:Predicted membrane protein